MIGVYYPYLEREGKWDELKYSLRSLERFFDAEYEVWIVGDLPDWIKDVQYIAHQKTERIVASSTFDAVSKLQLYLNNDRTPEQFIRMYDDVYFIGHRTVTDLELTRYLFTYDEFCHSDFKSGSAVWREQVVRTLESVVRWRDGETGRKGEIYMTETHCPEVFEKEKMREVMERFDPAGFRLLTSSLYYNTFPFEKKLKDRKVERALFYGYENEFSLKPNYTNCDELHKLLRGKYFLNHNDAGLDDGLKGYIMGMFQEKSRWEK